MTEVRSTRVVRDIDIRISPYDWGFPREYAARVDAHWAELRQGKPGLFDGRVLLARDLAVHGATLTGSAFVTGYKSFLCWRDFGYPDETVHNLFAMPALRAADGPFMVGRMSAGTANAGRLYFPAGTPEPSDAGADGRVRFDANILRELEEETGIGPADVRLDESWTVLFAGPAVACMKVARASVDAAALVERVANFVAGQREPELDGLLAVASPADIDAAHMPPFMQRYLAEHLSG